MSLDTDRFFVITGGPGSGKSTLIAALRRAGFAASEEVGRDIIKQQKEVKGRAVPWGDPQLFAELMLSWEIRTYRSLESSPGTAFFDRGIPDVLGYLRLLAIAVPAHMVRAAVLFRYNQRVFIAPPWRDIFEQDAERTQTIDEAERTYHSMVQTYAECGYEPVEIPRAPVADRVHFILQNLAKK